MADSLIDWPDPRFIRHVLSKHPAPRHPETQEPLWESGIRLQGNQTKLIFSRARFKQARGGIRGGKSYLAAVALYLDGLWRETETHVTDDLWGVVGDSYTMAQEEMRHLDRLLTEGGIPHDFHMPINQSWRITFPHKTAEYVTLTAADVTKLASRPYRGLVMAEASQMVWEVFINARGRVTQTRGWVLMEGTFERAGAWYYQVAEEWSKPDAVGESYSLPSWENLAMFPLGREEPVLMAEERDLEPELFMERYGGEPSKRSDRAMKYADERYQVRHRFERLGQSYDPERPVILCIDPGIAHAYAVGVFQLWRLEETGLVTAAEPGKANVAWMIDSVYRWGRTAEQMIEECAAKPWANRAWEAVMDFAGTQRRSEGPPNIEQWAKGWMAKVGHPLMIHANPVPLHAGYDVHKRALLNAWPEDAAQRSWNADKRLRTVTNPTGPRIMFDPEAAVPLFGGLVDGQRYLGEYNLHKMKKSRDGTITRDEYVDTDNDLIKAISYFTYWLFGAHDDRSKLIGFDHVPWKVTVGS